MSKSSSGLFARTIGTWASVTQDAPQLLSTRFRKLVIKEADDIKSIPANEIRFSQTSVNGSQEIIDSMVKNGWVGDPIDVVTMTDGGLTTIDNTRVVAAQIAGIDVKARIHAHDELITDPKTARRLSTKKGGIPTTWGEAAKFRIAKQNSSFRKNNPMGSYKMGKIN